MNIFVLDENPAKAAEYHCNKHVVKMIIESAQMLCSAHWLALEKKIKNTGLSIPSKVKDRKGKDKYYYLDCKKTMSELKWKSKVPIDTGLKKTIKFYDNLNKKLDKKDINFKL